MDEKERKVKIMFSSISKSYDFLSSFFTFGLIKRWKKFCIDKTNVFEGSSVLDLCTGTGDMAILLAKKIGKRGRVIAVDFNEDMLEIGREKILKLKLDKQIIFLLRDVKNINFPKNHFDSVTIGFGLRNVANRNELLKKIYYFLKPECRMVCLEFFYPKSKILRILYDFYSFKFMKNLGSFLSKDKTGIFEYLPNSIKEFHNQEKLKEIIKSTAFREVKYFNLLGGIAAIHIGVK